ISQPIAGKAFDPRPCNVNGIEETSTAQVPLEQGFQNHRFFGREAIQLVQKCFLDAPDVAGFSLVKALFEDDLILWPAQRFGQEKKLPDGGIIGSTAGPSHEKMGSSVEGANRQDRLEVGLGHVNISLITCPQRLFPVIADAFL